MIPQYDLLSSKEPKHAIKSRLPLIAALYNARLCFLVTLQSKIRIHNTTARHLRGIRIETEVAFPNTFADGSDKLGAVAAKHA